MDFGDHDVSFRNSGICIDRQFRLGIQSQQSPYDNDGTYVENLKDPVEVQPPCSNLVFIVLCVQMSRNHVSFALLDDLPLDLRHSPEVGLKRRQRVVQSV